MFRRKLSNFNLHSFVENCKEGSENYKVVNLAESRIKRRCKKFARQSSDMYLNPALRVGEKGRRGWRRRAVCEEDGKSDGSMGEQYG